MEINYPKQVGDIEEDLSIDDPNFRVCKEDRIPQYYEFSHGLMFGGEKKAIDRYFKEHYRNQSYESTGYLVVRFIVNCKGQTGRFRVSELDMALNQVNHNEKLVSQIISLVKNLKGWGTPSNGSESFDYYQYLTFKLVSGEIIEIMP